MDTPTPTLSEQLQQLKGLFDAGLLPQDQYEASRAELERRIQQQSASAGAQGHPPALAQPGAEAAGPVAAAPVTAAGTSARPKASLVAGLAVFVLALAAGGYAWKGTPHAPAISSQAAVDNGDAQRAQQLEQIAGMVDQLARRLEKQPGDAEGWTNLGRAYSMLGRNPEAITAFEKALVLRKDDASLLVDYADALAVKNNHNLAGEPVKLLQRALKLEPNHIKALALLGADAFERKDYAAAGALWEKLVAVSPADNPFARQFGPAIAEAHRLAGEGASQDSASTASAQAAAGSTVAGTVALSAALAGKADPQDTVFVFARAANGAPGAPRMPLAIVRKQVKDLPLRFVLDDSTAMSPANKLSGAGTVVVGARISKSGNAMPQPGDLQGLSKPVAVGSKDVQVDISEVVGAK